MRPTVQPQPVVGGGDGVAIGSVREFDTGLLTGQGI